MNRILLLLILLQSYASAMADTCSGVYSLKDSDWYEKQMKAANAKELCSTQSPRTERYRFIWLRTFHNPIIVTLTRTDKEIELVGLRLDGAGGYEPGRIVEEKRVSVSYAEFEEFQRYLRKMDFWSLKSQDEIAKDAMKANPDELIVGVDGAQWILEGAEATRAHSVDRWSAEGPFKEAALLLLGRSRIELNGPVY